MLDTSLIESLISRHCADAADDPELLDFLGAVAERRGAQASDGDLRDAARFVVAYIEQVPYMLKVAWTAAGTVGLENQMQRIIGMVTSYWVEGDDVIPDELGAIGLLDDAYCSLSSLQAVSDHYRLQTGKHLFPNDLSAANRAVRRIIGEPYASELDRIVIRTMSETGIIAALTALASDEKRLHLAANSTIWNHGPAGREDLDSLARLGVLDDPSS